MKMHGSLDTGTYTRHRPRCKGPLRETRRFPFVRQPARQGEDLRCGYRAGQIRHAPRPHRDAGEERAATLMAHLPPTGWADVATKQDLEHLRVATQKDIEVLRVAMQKDIDVLRELTTARFGSIEQRMATKQDIAELRAHMDETLRKQFNMVVTFVVALVGCLMVAAGFGVALIN